MGSKPTLQIALAGAQGRMGRCILDLVGRDEHKQIAAALTYAGDAAIGTALCHGDEEILLADRLGVPCDVMIDFSTPSGTMEWLEVCERMPIPMVIGVTGFTDEQTRRIDVASRAIPVFVAANFSVGMWALRQTAHSLAEQLGAGYDVEIVETHHRNKTDAPSGSALALVRSIASARGDAGGDGSASCSGNADAQGEDTEPDVIHGRFGEVGERPARQIGVHAVRMGDVIGRHEVHFGGLGEVITVTHTVHSRDNFASGALRAAEWLLERDPGLYHMNDMLGRA